MRGLLRADGAERAQDGEAVSGRDAWSVLADRRSKAQDDVIAAATLVSKAETDAQRITATIALAHAVGAYRALDSACDALWEMRQNDSKAVPS